jgi:hypothetical protein
MNYRDAVRRSFVAKLGVWLQKEESRNLGEYSTLSRTDGFVTFDVATPNFGSGTTTYAIVPLQRGDDLHYRAVNINFLDEIDLSPNRRRTKEYRLPAVITVIRDIDGNTNPNLLGVEILNILASILKCLEDGFVEIWDYAPTGTPQFTGKRGNWLRGPGYLPKDESMAVPGGHVAHSLTVFIDYKDFTNT